MVKLNSTLEIVDVLEVSQFQWSNGKPLTEYACGYFSCVMAKSMATVGQNPVLSVREVIDQAEAWYAKDHGNNLGTNTAGMSMQEEYDLLQHLGLHYQGLPLDIHVMQGWLKAGYPIVVAVAETSVFDLGLGHNPYPWNPAGNHIFLMTGVLPDGNFVVRDPANCTNLYNPNSLRPGPRHYDASRLRFVSATVIVPPWMPRPANNTPPTGGDTMPVPAGWTDKDGKLTAKNGHYLEHGFRQHVLDAPTWPPDDEPLMEEVGSPHPEIHLDPKQGSFVILKNEKLVYYPDRGVVVCSSGEEIYAYMKLVEGLQKQIADLKASKK